MTEYRGAYDTLSYGRFPRPVEAVLERVDLAGDPHQIEAEFAAAFGPGLLERKGTAVIERVTERTPPDAREQLLGTLGTLHHYRATHGMGIGGTERGDEKFRLDVWTLQCGSGVFLHHPGYKAYQYDHRLGPFPMDVGVNIEGWVNPTGNTTPLHKEVLSDFYWKLKEARVVRRDPEAADALVGAIGALQNGAFPVEVLERYGGRTGFSVGNRLEPLFHSAFWMFVQEDLNYARYGGRDTPYGIIEAIADLPRSAVDSTAEPYPDTVVEGEHEAYYGIIDDVSGYDREDGELLPVSEIAQPGFTLS